MSQTYTKEDTAKRYDSARALPAEALTLAMETLQSSLPLKQVKSVLDLGAGTGRFSQSLQETFHCPVIAVEPSEAMLAQGKSRRFDNIEWRQGSAENIPLSTNSVDLVWMCQVFHHLEDPARAFQEIRRVLVSRGCLAIRNGTRENEVEIEWSSCFPEAQQIDNERLPLSKTLSTSCVAKVSRASLCRRFTSCLQPHTPSIMKRSASADCHRSFPLVMKPSSPD